MILCKDCCWYEKAHILLDDGTAREYTDEEKELPVGVDASVGINVGGRCRYYSYNKTSWMSEDDFCSKGQKSPNKNNNKWLLMLKEKKNDSSKVD